MNKDSFDLDRVRDFLVREPDCNVIIIANNVELSLEYWKRIQGHIRMKKKSFIITNNEWSLDGAPIADAFILMVDRWWENKNARELMQHTSLAKLTLPITFIPPFMKGGDDNDEKEGDADG